jgi:DNA-binding transcriptional ArsR family regulator
MKHTEAVLILESLAQESRLAIFRALVEAGPGGLPAGEIAQRLQMPAPTLSFHLSQLKHAQLLTCMRKSRLLIYSANFAAMNKLVAFLTKNCCGGNPQRCASVPIRKKR